MDKEVVYYLSDSDMGKAEIWQKLFKALDAQPLREWYARRKEGDYSWLST